MIEKYARSLHSPISLGATSDDRIMKPGYLQYFKELDKLILTEKLDGQNNCFKKTGVFARSHGAVSKLPWDKPLIERWNLIRDDLGDLEIFGENLYAKHAIEYNKLESYFYVFAVRENGVWKSWEEVKFYAELFDFPTVPEIDIKFSLRTISHQNLNRTEDQILQEWLRVNLGMTWTDSVLTPGLLGGKNSKTGEAASEGFVIRNAAEFPCDSLEFSNLFKLVRENHVQTDVHWTKNYDVSGLIDCNKYKWFGYEYLMVNR